MFFKNWINFRVWLKKVNCRSNCCVIYHEDYLQDHKHDHHRSVNSSMTSPPDTPKKTNQPNQDIQASKTSLV